MKELDKEKLGVFIARLRKEKDLTQKDLADRLFVSDKAVSKWERGLSVPDVSLLMPLAELLGVTTTELLQGERITAPAMNVEQVEKLVTDAIHLTREEQQEQDRRRRWLWRGIWFLCAVVAVVEVIFLWQLGIPKNEFYDCIMMVEGITLCFSGYFCFLVKERLPEYYDNNPISVYSDRMFRMNLPGVRFTNQNWPHIIRVGRVWMLGVALVFPGLYLLARRILPGPGVRAVSLLSALSFFIPMIWVGKRYE